MGEGSWAVISLLALVAVVIIANWKSINIGLVGIAMAMLIGTLAGLKYKAIINNYNLTLFIRSMGMQSLIVVAKMNGTLEAVSKRIIKVGCGRAIRFLPVFLYVAMLLCEYAGTGVFSLALPILCALGLEMGMPVMKLATLGLLTMVGGGCSPFAPPGVTLAGLAQAEGIEMNFWNTGISGTIVSLVLFAIYYFAFGWYKEQPHNISTEVKVEPMTWKQWLTLAGYAIFVFCNLVLGLDMGITPIIIAITLCVIGVGDGSQLIKRLPWNSMIMVGGMTVMVGVVAALGGINLISGGLALIATKTLAPGLMTAISGAMSIISSASGVVMPTLVPTVNGLVELIPGVSAQSLVTAIGLGAYATAVSPMSTVGANVMANYGTVYAPSADDEKKVFNILLLMAGISWIAFTIAGILGLYGIVFVQ